MPLRPFALPSYIRDEQHEPVWFVENIQAIQKRMKDLQSKDPEVTVIIPAYNEQESILRTLSSLSKSKTSQRVEIIVVDNNSSDNTAELVKKERSYLCFRKETGC